MKYKSIALVMLVAGFTGVTALADSGPYQCPDTHAQVIPNSWGGCTVVDKGTDWDGGYCGDLRGFKLAVLNRVYLENVHEKYDRSVVCEYVFPNGQIKDLFGMKGMTYEPMPGSKFEKPVPGGVDTCTSNSPSECAWKTKDSSDWW